jgi:hypothetical protein
MLDYWQATFKLFSIYFKGSHDYYFGVRLDAQYRFCKLQVGHLWHPDITDDKQIAEGAIFEPRDRVDRIGKNSQLQISISSGKSLQHSPSPAHRRLPLFFDRSCWQSWIILLTWLRQALTSIIRPSIYAILLLMTGCHASFGLSHLELVCNRFHYCRIVMVCDCMKDILNFLLGVLIGLVYLLLSFAHKFFITVLAEQKLGIPSKIGQQQLLKFYGEFYHLLCTCD